MIQLITKIPLGVLKPKPARPELRRTLRRPLEARAWLRGQGLTLRAVVYDLNRDGAGVASDVEVTPGTPILLRCYLRGARTPFCAWARSVRSVQRADGRYDVGLSFHGLRQAEQQRLEAYFARHLAPQQRLSRWSEQFGL
ncbi:MAG: PilZ domain-containing protein [Pseudomonadota bacterium]